MQSNEYLADLEAKLANLEAERRAIDAREAALKKAIAGIRDWMNVESPASPFPSGDRTLSPNTFTGMSVMEAAEAYLKTANAAKTAAEIARALRSGGIKSESKYFLANLNTALLRRGESRGIIREGKTYRIGQSSNLLGLFEAANDGKGTILTIASAAENALKEAGAPLHANEILKRIEKMGVKTNKQTLVGTLIRYISKGKTFRRDSARPNTFALLT